MDIELNPYGFNALRMCRWGPMLYNRNDTSIGRSIEKYGEYSWLEQTVFEQVLNPGAVVVDYLRHGGGPPYCAHDLHGGCHCGRPNEGGRDGHACASG